jgi:hypothetical protein
VVDVGEREVRCAWARKVGRELCRVDGALGGRGGMVVVVVVVVVVEVVFGRGGGGEGEGGAVVGGLGLSPERLVVWSFAAEVEEQHRGAARTESREWRDAAGISPGLRRHFLAERASINSPLFACSSSLGSEGGLLMGIQRKLALEGEGGKSKLITRTGREGMGTGARVDS